MTKRKGRWGNLGPSHHEMDTHATGSSRQQKHRAVGQPKSLVVDGVELAICMVPYLNPAAMRAMKPLVGAATLWRMVCGVYAALMLRQVVGCGDE